MRGVQIERGARRRQGEAGASLVEFALIAPFLMMMVFGIVSAATAYNQKNSLTHAARESGRYAATLPTSNYSTLDGWLDAVAARAVANATGEAASGVPGRYVCVAYVHPQGTSATPLDRTRRRVETSGSPVYSDDDVCFTDDRPDDERRVQVLVRRDTDFDVLVFRHTVTLTGQGVTRFEAYLDLS